MRLPLSACLLAMALVACSQAGEPDDEVAASSDQSDTASDDAPQPEDELDGDAADDGANSAADKSGEPAVEPDRMFASSYTPLDLENCRVIAQSRGEGSWIEFRCQGLDGIPLFVSEGDGRFDIDVGVENPGFATIGAFNDVGDKVEWRKRDGRPFAVIFRYIDVSLETPDRTVLAVEKIGTSGKPGCRVAQIAGEVPRANQRARQIADAKAAGFDCSQEPEYVGNAR